MKDFILNWLTDGEIKVERRPKTDWEKWRPFRYSAIMIMFLYLLFIALID